MVARKPLNEGALNERAMHFLKVLVERYIRDGEPVGSRTLARDAATDLSPATIRNVMADLEEMGLVASPHTSAGRVPTVHGYRMFVDSLVTLMPLDAEQVELLRSELGVVESASEILGSASRLLSSVSRMAGVVMIPRRDQAAVDHLDFLPMSENRVLAILVTKEDEVINQILHVKRPFGRGELDHFANYLNAEFSGLTLAQMRDRVVQRMKDHRAEMDRMMRQALRLAGEVIQAQESAEDCLIAGQTNLMDFNELAEMSRLRGLFDAFSQKQGIVHLLEGCLNEEGVHIFIGEESGYQQLDQCSVITAPYEVDDRVVGVLGVIGPTRMAYDRVIPLVDVTAKLLGAALKHR